VLIFILNLLLIDNLMSNFSNIYLLRVCRDRKGPVGLVYLGDSRTTVVQGKCKVFLKFTYDMAETLPFGDVLHMPTIMTNLISGSNIE
jgi:hypothetical protein